MGINYDARPSGVTPSVSEGQAKKLDDKRPDPVNPQMKGVAAQ